MKRKKIDLGTDWIYFNGAAFERVMKYWINHGRRIERQKNKRKKK